MKVIQVGDIRFYNGAPVTVCGIEQRTPDDYYANIKWFVGNELKEKTVNVHNLSLMQKEPQYMDYIHHLEIAHEDTVYEDASSDGLVEFMLNDTVHTIQEIFPELDHDELVDAVYNVIHKLTGPFHYYLQCVAADGYQAAMYDVESKDELLAKELKENVLKNSEEFKRQ